MKFFISLCFVLVTLFCLVTGAAAKAPQLKLWITDPLGIDPVEKCLPKEQHQSAPLPDVAPTISELDIVAWDTKTALWSIKKEKLTATESMQNLQDHCFILAIDGVLISHGVALSSYSARLTKIPTLNVFYQDDTITLQLNSENRSSKRKPIHVEVIDRVLGSSAHLQKQLARLQENAMPEQHIALGRAWKNAIERLINASDISQGMSIDLLERKLGKPTQIRQVEDKQIYSWYFNTPMHVNPVFTVIVSHGAVMSYAMSSH